MANDIFVKINADAKQFNDEIEKVKDKTSDLESALGGVAKASALAFAGFLGSAVLAVKAFSDAEKSSVELTQALKNQGKTVEDNLKAYKSYADTVSKATGVDDDAIVAAQAKLQTYIGQTEITQDLTQAIVDLATQTGSLDSAAESLGRAYQGNVRGFNQFKIVIDENASAQERLQQAVDGSNARFGGFAEAIGNTSGSTAKLKVAIGNLVENVGSKLAPVFDKAVAAVTAFVIRINENEGLVEYGVILASIVATLLGAVAVFSSVGLGLLQLSKVVNIVSIAIKFLGISVRTATLATGIGALLLVIPLIIENFDLLKSVLYGLLKTLGEGFLGIGRLIDGLISRDFKKVKEGVDQIRGSVAQGIKVGKVEFEKSKNEADPLKEVTDQENAKNSLKKKLAESAAADLARVDKQKQEQAKNSEQIALLQARQGSEELIKIKQQENEILSKLESEKNPAIRAALEERLAIVQSLEIEAAKQAEERAAEVQANILARNEEYQALDDGQKAIFRAQNLQALETQYQTELDAKKKADLALLKQQVDTHNLFLENQRKFGATIATVQQFINTEEVQGAKKGAGELIALQNSKNATLRTIGKAAAVTDITIKTAQSAINVYQGFSQIPFIGQILGIAGAAAAIAFGAEQIGTVLSARDGGLVGGFNTGGDSVPSVLQAGELVVPRQNFSEVVQSVAASRNAAQAQSGAFSSSQTVGTAVTTQIQFSGDGAEKFLTSRQVESRSLGILQEAS